MHGPMLGIFEYSLQILMQEYKLIRDEFEVQLA